MGGDKASILFRGEPLLLRMIRTLRGLACPLVIAARKDQALPVLPNDVEVVYDSVEDFGPLAGMAAAFTSLTGRCEAVFVCACDYPLLRPDVVAALIDRLGSSRGVIPRTENESHPLLAVYRVELLGLLEDLIRRNEHRAQVFAREGGAVSIDANVFRDIDPALDSFRNVNDPRLLHELEHRPDDESDAALNGFHPPLI
jgi:molybdenum cofactor guanylyltransferase